MAKKTTLTSLAQQVASLTEQMAQGFASLSTRVGEMDARMERGFAAVAEDISKLATKEQIVALDTQVNAIETDIRGMKRAKLEGRVADLEDEVFGQPRA